MFMRLFVGVRAGAGAGAGGRERQPLCARSLEFVILQMP